MFELSSNRHETPQEFLDKQYREIAITLKQLQANQLSPRATLDDSLAALTAAGVDPVWGFVYLAANRKGDPCDSGQSRSEKPRLLEKPVRKLFFKKLQNPPYGSPLEPAKTNEALLVEIQGLVLPPQYQRLTTKSIHKLLFQYIQWFVAVIKAYNLRQPHSQFCFAINQGFLRNKLNLNPKQLRQYFAQHSAEIRLYHESIGIKSDRHNAVSPEAKDLEALVQFAYSVAAKKTTISQQLA